MTFGNHVAKVKLVEQLTLVTLQTAHHGSTSPRFASTQRNHGSPHPSMTFATWGNSGIEPDKGKGIGSPGKYGASLMLALQRWRAAMEFYVGLDVSLKQTSICVVDQTGLIGGEGGEAWDNGDISLV